MKKILLIAAALGCLTTAVAQNTWQLIPCGTTNNLNAVHAAGSTHAYIGGAFATCLKTTNSGFDWTTVHVPSENDFMSIWAASDNDVHIGTWDTILNTQNGGSSWSGVNPGTVNYWIMDLQFHSVQAGYAFLQASAFIKTGNGGTTWTELAGCGVIDDFLAGHMVDQNIGYAVGVTSIIGKTVDGGVTWTQYDWNGWTEWTAIDIEGVHFTTALKGTAVADSGVVFRTTDGGGHWTRSTIAGPEDRLKDVWFINENVGWIVGYHGLVFKTTDGGENWYQEPLITTNDLNSVCFINENLGWAVGNNGTILRFGGPTSVSAYEPSEQLFRIIPNPSHNNASIEINLPAARNIRIDLLDTGGKTIDTQTVNNTVPGLNRIPLGTGSLPAGFYLCRVYLEGKEMTQTLVVQ